MLVIAFLSVVLLTPPLWADSVHIKFKNLRSSKGDIFYLLFRTGEGFPDDVKRSFKQGQISTQKAQENLVLEDIPEGDYALTVFHDENSNNKLDVKVFGLPDEGVGFSNNPRIFFGPPSFSRSKFTVKGKTSLKVKVKYF